MKIEDLEKQLINKYTFNDFKGLVMNSKDHRALIYDCGDDEIIRIEFILMDKWIVLYSEKNEMGVLTINMIPFLEKEKRKQRIEKLERILEDDFSLGSCGGCI